jgi:hypothetical protein
MASDEPVNGRREAAELMQERDSRRDMLSDNGELVLRERSGLAQDLVGHAQLADVVEQAPEREIAQAFRRQPELVADLDGAESDTARVLLRVRVLLGEGDEQRADVRAEERLLFGDEIGALEVTEQRARPRRAAAEIEGDGESHGGDSDDLEAVAKPPTEL